jgi:hypothetical protein
LFFIKLIVKKRNQVFEHIATFSGRRTAKSYPTTFFIPSNVLSKMLDLDGDPDISFDCSAALRKFLLQTPSSELVGRL